MSDVIVKALVLGQLATNTYVVHHAGGREAAVIDPADEYAEIIAYLKDNGLSLSCVLLTHGHCDHISGLNGLRSYHPAPVAIHAKDADMLTDSQKNMSVFFAPFVCKAAERVFSAEGEEEAAGMRICRLHTPGHTGGSVCYTIGKVMFSGDTLFNGSIGRTDFPHSSARQMGESIEKLKRLQGDYTVYPGHGNRTTLDFERIHNPFLKGGAVF